jgi:hypothetical protein
LANQTINDYGRADLCINVKKRAELFRPLGHESWRWTCPEPSHRESGISALDSGLLLCTELLIRKITQ